jgi:release factor glutamine methyltransferase
MNRTWTVLELINETTAYFKKKNIESARLDAELLLAHCLSRERIQLYIDFERLVTADELSAFRELVRRRAAREPVAYLTGYRDFWSLKIAVEKGVLIPRPETELLVEEALKIFKRGTEDGVRITILEPGTGSGALSIALAQELKQCIVYATDISPAAIKIAQRNSRIHGCTGRVQFIQCDSLTSFRQKEIFDLIVSNPPYICSADMAGLAPEIREHEPVEALDGGPDGLSFYRQWIPQMPVLLNNNGWAVLEMGAGQSAAVSQLFQNTGAFADVQTVKDYAGHERIIRARKK